MRSALFPALSQPKPPVRHPPEGSVAAQGDEDLVVERAAISARALLQNRVLDLGGCERASLAPEDLLAQRPNGRTRETRPRQDFGDLLLDQPQFTEKLVTEIRLYQSAPVSVSNTDGLLHDLESINRQPYATVWMCVSPSTKTQACLVLSPTCNLYVVPS